MTWSAVPRTVNRLIIDVDAPFDEFRARYEEAVPAYDLTRVGQFSNWDDVRADVDRAAPYGLLRYGTIEAGPLFAIAGHKARSVVYLMGNHTIAETMYRHDPGIMLYAPCAPSSTRTSTEGPTSPLTSRATTSAASAIPTSPPPAGCSTRSWPPCSPPSACRSPTA